MMPIRTIRVRVSAGRKKERVQQKGDVYLLDVREPAERNRANMRVRQLLAQELQVPVSNVRMKTGARSPHKQFEITS